MAFGAAIQQKWAASKSRRRQRAVWVELIKWRTLKTCIRPWRGAGPGNADGRWTNLDLLGWSPLEAELPMCEKCTELVKKIEHCERIAASITDQLTIDRIKMLIEELRTRKAGLHP
jgi:hypothetical protein